MATLPAPSADDLFAAADACPRCDQLECECVKPAGLLGALADVPQPVEAAAAAPGLDVETIAAIYASDSVGAFLSVRVEQAMKFGHTPAADREQSPFHLPRQAQKRLAAVLEDVGRDQGGPARSADHLRRRQQALRRVRIAGALLMAAHDNLEALIAQGVRHG